MKHKYILLVIMAILFSCTKNNGKNIVIVRDDNIKSQNTLLNDNINNESAIEMNYKKTNTQNSEDELLSFMVYGEDFITSIALPNTWNVDMAYAQRHGINGFFYLKNYSINNSPAVIMLNLEYKQNKIFEEWITQDINEFLEYYNAFTAERLNWNIKNKDGYRIIIYSLKHSKMDLLQYTAYIDTELDYFVNIYVTIHDKSEDDEFVNVFKKCLENSSFSGIGVKIIN
jgi:hypothetical protein